MKLGYLVSQYPARSHTFILREIRELRKHGFDVRAISVTVPDRPIAEMTPVEAEEAGRSVSILGLPPAALAGIVLKRFSATPLDIFGRCLWRFACGKVRSGDCSLISHTSRRQSSRDTCS